MKKHCVGCKEPHPVKAFGADSSRADGLAATCLKYRREHYARTYKSQATGAPKGPPPIPARAGDKKQARRRVNVLVRTGKIPRPNALPCRDCGHVWIGSAPRHEYDHHLGYSSAHHLDVEAVCAPCHHVRAIERGER